MSDTIKRHKTSNKDINPTLILCIVMLCGSTVSYRLSDKSNVLIGLCQVRKVAFCQNKILRIESHSGSDCKIIKRLNSVKILRVF